MSQVTVLGSVIVLFILWRVTKRIIAAKSPFAHIRGPKKEHWLTGNYHRLYRDAYHYNLKLAEEYGGAVKIHALLGDEQLYVSDPLALHHMVIKEQHIYTEPDMFIMGNLLVFGEGLISTLDEQHRKQRKMLNPVFSMANMRDLLPIIQPIADKLCDLIEAQLPDNQSVKEVDLVNWISRGTLEYICQAALGHSFGALDSGKENEYLEAIRMLAPSSVKLLVIRPILPFIVRNFSLYWRNKMVDWVPIKAFRELRRVVEVMNVTSKQIFTERKAVMEGRAELDGTASSRSRMKGKDMMSIMLRANMSSSGTDRLADEELLGQMNTITFAGFETTASALGRIVSILASKSDVQTRLRHEVRDAKQKYAELQGITDPWERVGLPYDILMGLPYLDAIVRETLRMYPPSSLLSRTVREDTVLPLYQPIKSVSGEMLSSIPITKGSTVIMSLISANHNKELWGEDASDWRPERWLTETGQRISLSGDSDPEKESSSPSGLLNKTPGVKRGMKYPGVYGSMMTFLGGGRACIGFKFAEMELKQVLATLISRIHFSLPSAPDEKGNIKQIAWKYFGLPFPVVLPPAGDGVTSQLPLELRLLRPDDFL